MLTGWVVRFSLVSLVPVFSSLSSLSLACMSRFPPNQPTCPCDGTSSQVLKLPWLEKGCIAGGLRDPCMGRAPLSMLPLWRAGFVICFQSVLVEVLYCNQADEKKKVNYSKMAMLWLWVRVKRPTMIFFPRDLNIWFEKFCFQFWKLQFKMWLAHV